MLRCYGNFICFFFCLRVLFRQRCQRMAEVLPQHPGDYSVLLSDSIMHRIKPSSSSHQHRRKSQQRNPKTHHHHRIFDLVFRRAGIVVFNSICNSICASAAPAPLLGAGNALCVVIASNAVSCVSLASFSFKHRPPCKPLRRQLQRLNFLVPS